MTSRNRTRKRQKSSINYWSIPLDVQSFEPDSLLSKESNSNSQSKTSGQSENRTFSNRISTAQLASKLGGIWSYIGQPTVYETKGNYNKEIHRANAICQISPNSTYEDLKKFKKKLLFSYCNTVFSPMLVHTKREIGADIGESVIKKDIIKRESVCTISIKESNSLHSTNDCLEIFHKEPDSVSSTKEASVVLENKILDLQFDQSIEILTSTDCRIPEQELTSSSVSESREEDSSKEFYVNKDELSVQNRVKSTIYMNRHALAGAMAGTVVSFCLHPVDTIKTIIQAKGIGDNSFYDILRRTVNERGILGLYRGIASNIASSAPISAIYTFTYESVKGALLPVLPQDYHSLAHCIAGGCSSIATSFVFTPSERIKQQMQVGSQYQNCWNALFGCIEKGGVTSLYAGWSAVLCRNIPHSIIKFYTYERLKLLLSTPDASLSSCQTLVCGGLAGSTAALFTTPFDVVKTKIQTQAPGSNSKYNGVLHALAEITKNDGLQGLYRGLTPRLAMYISQGAIFFASYEFLKTVFALNCPQKPTQVIQKEEEGDNNIPL